MDEVEFFGQRMRRDWAKMLEETQLETHYVDASGRYKRIPYGSETFRQVGETSPTPCRHCCTIYKKLHEPSCSYEQCPKCNGQAITCDCEFYGHEWREQNKS